MVYRVQGARLHLIWVDRAAGFAVRPSAPLLINRFWQNCFTLRRARYRGLLGFWGWVRTCVLTSYSLAHTAIICCVGVRSRIIARMSCDRL